MFNTGMLAISEQMQMDRRSREALQKKEIKARDRVDISLDEYEKMKTEISSLRWEVDQMRDKIGLFNKVIDLNIIQDTFIDLYIHDPAEMKAKCRIEFEFVPGLYMTDI